MRSGSSLAPSRPSRHRVPGGLRGPEARLHRLLVTPDHGRTPTRRQTPRRRDPERCPPVDDTYLLSEPTTRASGSRRLGGLEKNSVARWDLHLRRKSSLSPAEIFDRRGHPVAGPAANRVRQTPGPAGGRPSPIPPPPPLPFWWLPMAGATVAGLGMTLCPCRIHDPGVLSPGLVALVDR